MTTQPHASSGGGADPLGMTKRELIDTGRDKRYARRDEQGKFQESDDVGRSLATDQKRDAKTEAPRGEGDRGDRKDR